MPINWHKLRKMKRSKQAKISDICFDSDDRSPYEDSRHYEDTLPEEAIMMSRRGRAKGYDLLRYGDGYGDLSEPIVEITKKGVQFLVDSATEKAWLTEVENSPARYKARKEMIRKWNWTSWEDLLPINREFLLSLLWIPVDPYNAMEILARAAR